MWFLYWGEGLYRTGHIFLAELIKEEWYTYVQQTFLNNTSQVLNSEFFLLLDWLPYQSWRIQSALLFIHSWKGKKEGIIPFLRASIWNATSFIQDLNTHTYGNALSVMVGNGISNSSSKPTQGCFHFPLHTCSWGKAYHLFSIGE